MYSPTVSLSSSPSIIPSPLDVPRRPPPVRPSRSLDGLEQVVPPTGLAYYPYHSHSRPLPPSPLSRSYSSCPSPPPRSDLRLNKPLPPRPPSLAPETALASSAPDKDQTQTQTHVHSQLYSPSTTATSTSITLSEDSLVSSFDYPLGPRHEGDKSQDQTQRSHSAVAVEAVPIGLKPEVIEVQLRQAQQQRRRRQQHESQTRRSVSFSEAIFYPQVLEDSDEETAIEDDSVQTAAPAGTKEDDNEADEEADEEEERKLALALKAFVSEELYGRHVHFLPPTWSSSSRIATSHYFREKKWSFFPELAMPSQLQMEKMPGKWGPFMATTAKNNGRKMTDKYHGKIKGTVHGFRDSIKYFHLNRKLMKEAACSGLAPPLDEDNGNRNKKGKLAEKPPSGHSRVMTASSSTSYSSPRLHGSFTSSSASSSRDEPRNYGSWESSGLPYRHRGRRSDTCDGELETGSTSKYKTRTESRDKVKRRSDDADNEAYGQQHLTTRTYGRTSSTNLPKQRAVPLSPYQKYGPAIWESHKSPRKRHVRFARTHRSSSSASSSMHSSTGESQSTAASSVDDSSDSYYRITPPPKSPYRTRSNISMKTTVDGRRNRGPSQVLGDAKKMITESKADRRREELKAQIKLVGPLNAHTFYRREEWY